MTDIKFLLETDWLLKDPIDFEHKQYILLDYLKKIDNLIEEVKIYPAFTEISLHLTSLRMIYTNDTIMYTNKKLRFADDEVLLKDLEYREIGPLNKQEVTELKNIVKYSSNLFYEYFETIKHFWGLAFNSIELIHKRNKKNINYDFGYVSYVDNDTDNTYTWEYIINKYKINSVENNTEFNLIYSGSTSGHNLDDVILNNSKLIIKNKRTAPVFIVNVHQKFPMDETLVPLIKRKLISYIFQSVRFDK